MKTEIGSGAMGLEARGAFAVPARFGANKRGYSAACASRLR